jgi:hypothetical protein
MMKESHNPNVGTGETVSADLVTCYVGYDHDAADGRHLYGGWHYTVIEGPDGTDMPGDPLVLGEDGTYRPADAQDVSHHAQHHKRYASIVPHLSDADRDRLRELLDAQEA